MYELTALSISVVVEEQNYYGNIVLVSRVNIRTFFFFLLCDFTHFRDDFGCSKAFKFPYNFCSPPNVSGS
jgi:hypothetical protein